MPKLQCCLAHGLWGDSAVCPACGKDTVAMEKELTALRQKETWQQLDRGRMHYRILLILNILIALGFVIGIVQGDRLITGNFQKRADEPIPGGTDAVTLGRLLMELLFFFVIWIAAFSGKSLGPPVAWHLGCSAGGADLAPRFCGRAGAIISWRISGWN